MFRAKRSADEVLQLKNMHCVLRVTSTLSIFLSVKHFLWPTSLLNLILASLKPNYLIQLAYVNGRHDTVRQTKIVGEKDSVLQCFLQEHLMRGLIFCFACVQLCVLNKNNAVLYLR